MLEVYLTNLIYDRGGFRRYRSAHISELKQVTFLTTRTSTGSKVDVFHQSQPLTQSSDVTHAVRVVKNVTCLSSLLTHQYIKENPTRS